MNLLPASIRFPALAALLACLCVLAPTAWLTLRLSRDAAQRDEARLGELVTAAQKAITAESNRHQGLMQTWRTRIEAMPALDDGSWARMFDGPETAKLGRFRAVGGAIWEEGEKLVVRWMKTRAPGEGFSMGSDLAALREVRAALERERRNLHGLIVRTTRMEIAGNAGQIVALTSFQRGPAERGVLLAVLAPEDLLRPVRTISWRMNPDQTRGEQIVQETNLPGAGEGMLRVEAVSAEERERRRRMPGTGPTLGMAGPMGDLNLIFTPGVNFGRDSLANEARLAAAAGLLAALLLAALAWILARQRGVLAERVAARTAELAATRDELHAALESERELVRLKSQFVNTVSHEFRTPLGVILSSADILTHYLDRLPPEARQEHLRDIHTSSRHMARMLEQVLELGRIEAGRFACIPRPLDLGALLQRIADESHSASAGGPIELVPGDGLAGAQADEALLRHILLNLLSNARKYSAPETPVEFAARREGDAAVFTVRDSGIGIPAAELPGIFEAFARGSNVGDASGTGLGLAIAKQCADLHGGTILLASEEGHGTLVTVRLPLFARALS